MLYHYGEHDTGLFAFETGFKTPELVWKCVTTAKTAIASTAMAGKAGNTSIFDGGDSEAIKGVFRALRSGDPIEAFIKASTPSQIDPRSGEVPKKDYFEKTPPIRWPGPDIDKQPSHYPA